MLRKMFALLLCLMLLVPAACAEMAANQYVIDEIGVTATMPEQFNIVLTRDTPADYEGYAAIGLSKADADAYLTQMNIYLDAMTVTEAGLTQELTLTAVPNTQLETMDGITDEDLLATGQMLTAQYAERGVTVTNVEVVKASGHKYMFIWQTLEGATGLQCYTIQNNLGISFTLTKFGAETTVLDKLTMMSLLVGVTYAE